MAGMNEYLGHIHTHIHHLDLNSNILKNTLPTDRKLWLSDYVSQGMIPQINTIIIIQVVRNTGYQVLFPELPAQNLKPNNHLLLKETFVLFFFLVFNVCYLLL